MCCTEFYQQWLGHYSLSLSDTLTVCVHVSMWELQGMSLGVFGQNSYRNFLRGNVPGELNTFKGFYLLAFALQIGTPYVSYVNWPAVGTPPSLLRDLQRNFTTTTNES